jgi:hypothetical protein
MTIDMGLVLLMRSGCELCDGVALELRRNGTPFRTIEIDYDPALRLQYDEAVPVLLYNGKELARAPLTPRMLWASLRRAGIGGPRR